MDSVRGSICRSCRQRLAAQTKSRSFRTSAARSVIPPESPQFVDVPSMHQPYLPFRKPEKGFIPPPRELFPANRPDKGTKEYLENVTKEPLSENIVPLHKLTATQKYKAKMAEIRRSQLREGLTGLRARKQAEIDKMARRSQAKQLERNALLTQAEREDARLTNVSIPKEMDPNAQTSLKALEAEVATAKRIHETKVANLQRIQEQKHAEKMDALHTLYMNARDFITTEEQLKARIAAQFDRTTDLMGANAKHADFKNDEGAGESMWNMGPPDSIKKMIKTATGRLEGKEMKNVIQKSNSLSDLEKALFNREQERFKKIAEKLSGGKI